MTSSRGRRTFTVRLQHRKRGELHELILSISRTFQGFIAITEGWFERKKLGVLADVYFPSRARREMAWTVT
jgi:hypothetical protein